MRTVRLFSLVAASFAAVVVATAGSAWSVDEIFPADVDEGQLIALLESADSSPAEKAISCKKLAVFGSKNAVPALAPLLHDELLISWARIALEAIPGPEADAVLREAMGTLEGRSLIGVINSIGYRRDINAVAGLAGQLQNKDAEIASAAAAALGKIGDEPATKALRQALATAPESVRSAVAEGCIYVAERLLADGKAAEAKEIYDEVRQAKVPKPRVLEATRGAILARKSDGLPLLVEQLRSEDKQAFQMALMTAREITAPEVADAVVAEMAKAPPQRVALLLSVLADRADVSASPVVMQIVKSGATPTRIAAIGVLRKAGDVACVPTLLAITVDDDAEVASAAKTALAEWPGNEVDAQIIERLNREQGKSLQAVIELVGQRRIDATEALLRAINDTEDNIRAAALTALGETIQQDDLSVLIAKVASPKYTEDAPIAEKALRAACVRMPDGEACADELAAAMARLPVASQIKFLEILGAMHNPKSLETLASAAQSGADELQDAATRLLGETMTLDAGPVLLELAKTLPDGKYKIRAQRGFIRLVRQFNMTDRQRVQMCADALGAAQRSDEQKLILEVMERYPSAGMLKLAAQETKNPALKDDATQVMLAIAQKLAGSGNRARALLAKLGQKPLKVEIIKAEYGAEGKLKDVTKILQDSAGDLPIITLPSSRYNSAFGGDPAMGTPKQLKIKYRIDGKAGEVTLSENAQILLPIPK